MPRFTLATDYAIVILDFRTPTSTRPRKEISEPLSIKNDECSDCRPECHWALQNQHRYECSASGLKLRVRRCAGYMQNLVRWNENRTDLATRPAGIILIEEFNLSRVDCRVDDQLPIQHSLRYCHFLHYSARILRDRCPVPAELRQSGVRVRSGRPNRWLGRGRRC